MPFGERITDMAPERYLRIRDLFGELAPAALDDLASWNISDHYPLWVEFSG
jgi:hypothetical protein